jgi:hypothetical protein
MFRAPAGRGAGGPGRFLPDFRPQVPPGGLGDRAFAPLSLVVASAGRIGVVAGARRRRSARVDGLEFIESGCQEREHVLTAAS